MHEASSNSATNVSITGSFVKNRTESSFIENQRNTTIVIDTVEI